MSNKLAILGCRGCRRRFTFRLHEGRLEGHRMAFVCPKCGRPSGMRLREDANRDPTTGADALIAPGAGAAFHFGEIASAPGTVILARLLRRELRLGMVSALAGAAGMEVAQEKATGRGTNRRYFLAGVAKQNGAPFWRALIELPDRDERLAFFRREYESSRAMLQEPFVKAETRGAALEETMQIVLSGELLAHTPLAEEAVNFSRALCAHALAREVFWAAYLEESMTVPEIEEIFAQARISQERVRDLESALGELRQEIEARCGSLWESEPDAAVELRERLQAESEDLPADALAYEPD